MAKTQRQWACLRVALAAGDGLALSISMLLASGLKYGPYAPSVEPTQPPVALAFIPIVILLFWWQRLYDEEYLLVGSQEYARAAAATTYGTVAIVALSFFAGGSPIVPRAWLLYFWVSSFLTVCLWRFLARRIVRRLRGMGCFTTTLIVAGASDQGVAIAEQLDGSAGHGTIVAGFVDDYLPVDTVVTTSHHTRGHELRVIGSPALLPQLVREHAARFVVVVPQALTWESLETIVRQVALNNAPFKVRLAPGLYDILATGVRPAPRSGVPLLVLEKASITGIDRVLKALLDRGASAAALIVCAPLFGALIAGGRLRHQRPLFERRLIVGLGGRVHSVTFFGHWLAGHRVLRGLPALLGVLLGHVSLVGPRPLVESASGIRPDNLASLLSVKPGLTGLWRFVQPDTEEHPSYYDLWYVRNYTIWEDIRILFQTVLRLAASPAHCDAKFHRWSPGDAPPKGVDDAARPRVPVVASK